jgi:hypothetical protein
MQDRAPAEGRAQTCIPYPHFKSYYCFVKKWMQDTGRIPRVRVFRSMRRTFRLVPGIGYLAPGTRDLIAAEGRIPSTEDRGRGLSTGKPVHGVCIVHARCARFPVLGARYPVSDTRNPVPHGPTAVLPHYPTPLPMFLDRWFGGCPMKRSDSG